MTDTFAADVLALRPTLTAAAWRMARNKDGADEILQETYARAFKAKHQFQPGTNLCGWLCTIMANVFRDQQNKLKRRDPIKLLPFHSESYTPADPVEFREIFDAIDEMPPKFAAALVEVGTGAKYEEAAIELGVKVGTIKSRVSRGRAILVNKFGAMT